MGSLTAKTSGDIASFMTPAETNIKSLKVYFSPKQLGEGDPSPENVREIVGWDGVEVTKSSINLLDQSYITEASGWALSSDNGNTMYCGVPVYKGNINKFYTKFKSSYPFIGNPFKENVQYNVSVWLKTVSGNSIQGLKFGFKYTDGTTSLGGIFSANDTWKRQTVTSKANKTVSGIYCTYNNNGDIYLCGLAVCEKEFDDTSVVYPSAVNNISIDWSNNIETVYGGYIDLISGELIEEYNFVSIDYSNPWGTTTNYLYRNDNLPSSIGGRNMYVKTLCSHRINPYDVTAAVTTGTQGMLSVGRKFCEMAGIEMTSDAFNQYLMEQNNNGTPLEICYLLATPITHQLTPTQLSSFIGQNNFWSNADYVEIEYELKETEDIQKARKKIILNQPHIETVKDDLVNFTTNMKAPLKECKVYFEPVQEGEGDPSPDNAKPISGWEGMQLYHTGANVSNFSVTQHYGVATRLYVFASAFLKAGTYYLNVEKTAGSYTGAVGLYLTNVIDDHFVRQGDNYNILSAKTFTIPKDGLYSAYLYSGSITSADEAKISLTTDDSVVYDDQRTVIPISWQSEAGTVYGGYIDLVKGELVATYTYQTFDGDEPWSAYGSSAYRFALQPSNGFPRKKNGQDNIICDSYLAHGYNSNYYVALSGTQALYPTAQDLKDALSQNPVHVCYELLEPIHYQLTPQQFLSLKGTNNIWSNTNSQIEVKF